MSSLIVRPARDIDMRAEQLHQKALRRLAVDRGISRGFEAWSAIYFDHLHRLQLLRRASAQLTRPKLVSSYAFWKDEWKDEADAFTAAVSSASPLLFMVDADGDGTSDGLHADKLGVYAPQSGLTNGRPVYENRYKASLLVWWTGGKWFLGKRDELGRSRGWLKATSDSATPPETGWTVYSSAEAAWVPMSGMEARPASITEMRAEHLHQMAVRRLQNQGYSRVFEQWSVVCAESVQIRQLLRRASARLAKPRLVDCYSFWKHESELEIARLAVEAEKARTAEAKQKAAQMAKEAKVNKRVERMFEKAVHRLGKQALTRSFTEWADIYLEGVRIEQVMRRASTRLAAPKLVASYSLWRQDWTSEVNRLAAEAQAAKEEEEKEKRVEHLYGTAVRRLALRGLARGFDAWSGIYLEGVRRRRLLRGAAMRLRRPKLVSSYSHWQQDWDQKQRRDLAAAAEQKRAEKLKAMVARQEAEAEKKNRAEAALLAAREEAKRAAEEEERQKRVERLHQLAVRRLRKQGLSHGFDSWADAYLEGARIKQLLRRASARLAQPKLVQTYGLWRQEWKAELERLAAEELAWQAAKLAVEKEKKVERMYETAVRRMGAQGLSRGFERWTEVYLEQARSQRLLRRAGNRLAMPRLTRAFTAWQEQWDAEMKSQAAAKLIEESRAQLLRGDGAREVLISRPTLTPLGVRIYTDKELDQRNLWGLREIQLGAAEFGGRLCSQRPVVSAAEGAAAEAGLRQHDVLLAINDHFDPSGDKVRELVQTLTGTIRIVARPLDMLLDASTKKKLTPRSFSSPTSVVAFTLKLAGDVSSFTPSVQAEIAHAIAAEAGVQPSAVEVAVTSGSVIVNVCIHTPTPTAASLQATMASATSSPSSATAMLASVSSVPCTVIAISKPATLSHPAMSSLNAGQRLTSSILKPDWDGSPRPGVPSTKPQPTQAESKAPSSPGFVKPPPWRNIHVSPDLRPPVVPPKMASGVLLTARGMKSSMQLCRELREVRDKIHFMEKRVEQAYKATRGTRLEFHQSVESCKHSLEQNPSLAVDPRGPEALAAAEAAVDVDKIKERYLEQYGAKPTEKALKVETKLATGTAVRRREEANKPVVEALAELEEIASLGVETLQMHEERLFGFLSITLPEHEQDLGAHFDARNQVVNCKQRKADLLVDEATHECLRLATEQEDAARWAINEALKAVRRERTAIEVCKADLQRAAQEKLRLMEKYRKDDLRGTTFTSWNKVELDAAASESKLAARLAIGN